MVSSLALDIQNISADYHGDAVLGDVSFSVKAGECHGLMGVNGAGKTTLLKIVLSLKEANSGQCLIHGQPSYDPEIRKLFAFLPERFDPPWFLSGMEFLDFSLELYGKKNDHDRACEYADRLKLDRAFLKKRVQTYSKGMRQKLGILATVLTDCPLLILDEPMSGLDPSARAHVKDILGGVLKDGRTIFFSSHILADMEEICKTVSLMHEGKILETSSPSAFVKKMQCDNLDRAFLKAIQPA
jgi:ABC-2 type transport system ATP-binding protein